MQQLQVQLDELAERLAGVAGDLAKLPLYGVPFAIKDNIDVAGWLTTAACPEFAYTAAADATWSPSLRAAGAIVIGKTNLDQFATGLVGTRSPYGAVPNSFDPHLRQRRLQFRLGQRGRARPGALCPGYRYRRLRPRAAGFNNIVGLKPTKGWLSTRGLLPACRTLDCISVFALTVADAQAVATIAGGFDAADPYSRENPNSAKVGMPARPRLAVPAAPEFFGDAQNQAVFEQALGQLRELGAELVEIDFAPFRELAEQLYLRFLGRRTHGGAGARRSRAYQPGGTRHRGGR